MPNLNTQSNDYPDVVVHGTETVAPAGATVLADTGAVPTVGHWKANVVIGTDDTAQNIVQIAHRNAANAADIEVADFTIGANCPPVVSAMFNMAASERIVVRNKNAVTAAKTIQANLYAWLLA